MVDLSQSSLQMLVKVCFYGLLGLHFVCGADDCAERWPRCICTAESVECHIETALTDITEFFHCIQDNVEKVIIVGSKLKELPQNALGSCNHDSSLVLQELKLLDLSNNTIEFIHGKSFHCMPNLETLVLAHNQWKVDLQPDHTGYFASLPILKHLDLTNAFENIWNGSYHFVNLSNVFNQNDMSQLQTLKIAHNEFFSFSIEATNSICNLDSLTLLDLSHNNLDHPSLPTRSNCLEKLEYLNMSYNSMPRLPREFMEKMENLTNLKEVKLDNNPYKCDCGLLDTWKWVNSTKLSINKNELVCASGFHPSYIGKPLLSLKPTDLQCDEHILPPYSVVNEKPIDKPTLRLTISDVLKWESNSAMKEEPADKPTPRLVISDVLQWESNSAVKQEMGLLFAVTYAMLFAADKITG